MIGQSFPPVCFILSLCAMVMVAAALAAFASTRYNEMNLQYLCGKLFLVQATVHSYII